MGRFVTLDNLLFVQHDIGFMLFPSIGCIKSLIAFHASTKVLVSETVKFEFLPETVSPLCVFVTSFESVSPPVLTDTTSSMFYGNLSYRTFRVFSLLKGLE